MSTEQDIIYGIRHCVAKAAETTKDKALDDTDFAESKQEYNLTRKLGDDKKSSFTFKDYAPAAFHKLREQFGVSSQQFLDSWEMDPTLKLELSTARSGSMFYRTKDKKYLFKTILHPEVGAMMALLKAYYQHVCSNPETFIVKIYGLYRLKEGLSAKTWILIMGNSFPPGLKMFEEYDLKGRVPKPGKSIEERAPVTVRGPKKDNEIKRYLRFYEKEKAFFLKQLSQDVTLLKANNIMDYSLLIGIYRLSPEELTYEAKKEKAIESSPATTPKSSRKSDKADKSPKPSKSSRSSEKRRKHPNGETDKVASTPRKEGDQSKKADKKKEESSKPTRTDSGRHTKKEPKKKGSTSSSSEEKKEKIPVIKVSEPENDPSRVFKFNGLRAFWIDENEVRHEEIIFLGIIDNLTIYNFNKQVAHFCKKRLWDSETLSTVTADFYAQRFTNWTSGRLLGDTSKAEITEEEQAIKAGLTPSSIQLMKDPQPETSSSFSSAGGKPKKSLKIEAKEPKGSDSPLSPKKKHVADSEPTTPKTSKKKSDLSPVKDAPTKEPQTSKKTKEAKDKDANKDVDATATPKDKKPKEATKEKDVDATPKDKKLKEATKESTNTTSDAPKEKKPKEPKESETPKTDKKSKEPAAKEENGSPTPRKAKEPKVKA